MPIWVSSICHQPLANIGPARVIEAVYGQSRRRGVVLLLFLPGLYQSALGRLKFVMGFGRQLRPLSCYYSLTLATGVRVGRCKLLYSVDCGAQWRPVTVQLVHCRAFVTCVFNVPVPWYYIIGIICRDF